MSFTGKGGKVPRLTEQGLSRPHTSAVAIQIAGALRRGYGRLASMAKVIADRTERNERTVKGWLDGASAPDASSLVALMRDSDDVFDEICRLAGRDPDSANAKLRQLQAVLKGEGA